MVPDTFAMRRKNFLLVILAAAVLLLFMHVPAAADEPEGRVDFFPSFGTGPVEVRIYASYFCPPCRALEPELEPVLKELVKTGSIQVTFVDAPFAQAIPYIHYYLYALNEEGSLDNAFKVRHILFDVAKKYGGAEDIREAFENEGIPYAPFDPSAVFMQFNQYFQDDGVRSTPSATIRMNGESSLYTGGRNILPALEDLKGDKDDPK